MPRYTCVPILLAATVLAASCDDRDSLPTEPTTTITAEMVFSATAPTTTTLTRPGEYVACPPFARFRIDLGLVVRADASDLVLTEVRVRFRDDNGSQMPQVTLPAPQLTVQFGSALVAARSVRTFPLSFDPGCGFTRRGIVFIDVDSRDHRGGSLTGTIKVPVE